MSWWTHPELGPVRPIPRRRAARKTWRHFYAPDERWEQLADASPHACWREAVEAGAPERPPGIDVLDDFGSGTRVVQEHHDRHYRPTYVAELQREETVAARKRGGRRWVARTPGAVYVVIEPKRLATPAEIVTAYRPHPPGRGVSWTETDFLRHADWCFGQETGMKPDDAVKGLVAELEEVTARGVSRPADVWWLAHAVARARGIGGTPALAQLLRSAEELLAGVEPAWIDQFVGRASMEERLTALRVGLQDEDSQELEEALGALSDWLEVAAVLDEEDRASKALERASDLLDWVDGTWLDLADVAGHRSDSAADGSRARQLWVILHDAVLAAAAQSTDPARVAPSSLVDKLLPPEEPRWRVWIGRANSVPAGPSYAAAGRQLRQFTLRPAAARALGGAEEWAVRHAVAAPADLRLFFVEPEHPDGYEVSEHLSDPEANVWLLECPGAEALAVLFVGPVPSTLATLSDCLQYARDHDEVSVATRLFSRPS
jgi:hypothetical protein